MNAEEMNSHAQRMAQLFPPDKIVKECECCQRRSAELRALFEWRGEYLTVQNAIVGAVGTLLSVALTRHLFHSLLPSQQIDFSTTHGLCEGCFMEIKRKKFIARFIKQFCLALIVLAAMIFAAVIVFVALFVFPHLTKATIAYTAIGLCCGLICLWVGLCSEDRIVRWCVPNTLRFISNPPFELVDFRKS